uniref:WD repeat-containing protein 4 n=1 Tax=Leptobrachium leishanense TaxID=445787 RepID=A0A8C5LU33_9ANUR
MLRLRAGGLCVTGGSALLGGNAGDPAAALSVFDCSVFEKPVQLLGPDASSEGPVGSDKILAAVFSQSGEFFALTDERKRLVLFRTKPTWEKLSVRSVSRRCTALTFSPCGQHILAADKSGDVFSFSVVRAQEEGCLELGHLSMLLDVAVSPDGQHIITCDRDEKIRVSRWDAPHEISTFCLGHTEFVSQLLVLPGDNKLLLSGSGDGFLRLWHYETGTEMDNWDLSRSSDSPESRRFPVSRISCCSKGQHVAVLCDSIPGMFLLSVSTWLRLTPPQYLALSSPPVDLDFDESTSVWVLHDDAEKPLVRYRQTDGRWQLVPEDDTVTNISNAIRTNWDLLKGPWAAQSRFQGLYKVPCDNMASYLRKKEARIEVEKRKVAPESHVSASKAQKMER